MYMYDVRGLFFTIYIRPRFIRFHTRRVVDPVPGHPPSALRATVVVLTVPPTYLQHAAWHGVIVSHSGVIVAHVMCVWCVHTRSYNDVGARRKCVYIGHSSLMSSHRTLVVKDT